MKKDNFIEIIISIYLIINIVYIGVLIGKYLYSSINTNTNSSGEAVVQYITEYNYFYGGADYE